MKSCRFLFNSMSSFSRKNVYGGESTRHRGGITADHVLRQGVHLNAACMQVAFDLVPIGWLAHVLQQMAQAIVTHIQWLDELSGQVAQGVVHALEVGFHRNFPV